MLSKQEAESIKKQIIEQVKATVPEDKRKQVSEQILAMSEEELEQFLIQNNAISKQKQQECVFCSIASGRIPSFKILDNPEFSVALEINPISRGHILLIPKKHDTNRKTLDKLSKKAIEILSEALKAIYNPKKILTASAVLMGHEIMNLIPIYKDETIESKRYSENPKELEKIQKEIILMLGKTTKKETEKIQQCIFCLILNKKVPSYKINENKDSVAILEINPIAKGHSIVIPNEHVSTPEKIPQSVFALAKKIAKKIQRKLKPKEVQIHSSNAFGHEILNILPVYKEETMDSQRYQEEKEKLEKLKKKLEKKPSKKKPKTKSVPKSSPEPEEKEKHQKKEDTKEERMLIPKRIP